MGRSHKEQCIALLTHYKKGNITLTENDVDTILEFIEKVIE